jgi:hypothetical protein
LPLPAAVSVEDKTASSRIQKRGLRVVHTRLGEEGAEAVIGLSGLALVGEEAIGLKWRSATAMRGGKKNQSIQNIPGCRAQGSKATTRGRLVPQIIHVRPTTARSVVGARRRGGPRGSQGTSSIPPSTSWQFGNRPGRLYTNNVSILPTEPKDIGAELQLCVADPNITRCGEAQKRAPRWGEKEK